MSRCDRCPSSARTGIRRRHGLPGTSLFPTRPSCSCSPITTSIACSTARASRWRIWRSAQPEMKDPRKVWRIFASHYYLFRGTPTRMWLDFAFQELFGLEERLSEKTADLYFDTISEKLRTPEFLPRALYERFNMEVLATTDSPLDSLADHKAIRDSGWKARILPDLPARPGGRSGVCRICGQHCAAGRADRRRHLDLGRLPERAAQGARTLQGTGLHGDRPRAPHRANRRPFRGRGRGTLSRGAWRQRRRRASRSSSAPRC